MPEIKNKGKAGKKAASAKYKKQARQGAAGERFQMDADAGSGTCGQARRSRQKEGWLQKLHPQNTKAWRIKTQRGNSSGQMQEPGSSGTPGQDWRSRWKAGWR